MNQYPICPRCLSGRDSDEDGNCYVCSKWTDEEAKIHADWVRVVLNDKVDFPDSTFGS
jgi:hypothetical protein